jgi:hypothetical protein
MRFRLRTLLILLVVGPPLLAYGYIKWYEHVYIEAVRKALRQHAAEMHREQVQAAPSVNAEWEIGLGADMVPTFEQKP